MLWPIELALPAGRCRRPCGGPRLHRGSVDRSGAWPPFLAGEWRATKLLRGLNRPLPLPWAKTTIPSASRRKAEDSFKGAGSPRESYCRFIHCRPSGCILHFFIFRSRTKGRAGVATVRPVGTRATSPHIKAVAAVMQRRQLPRYVVTRSSMAFRGAETKMYNPTASPSRTEPTSSHCVLVIDAPPASHFTETQQV